MCRVTTNRKRVAVIGGGISGLACAWLLQKQSDDTDVVLFEEGAVAGGHAMTVDVELLQRRANDTEDKRVQVAVDVGFQVFNLTTYPHLVGFFEELGVTSQPSDMSFGCSVPLASDDDVFEWSSTRNLSTIFPEYSKYLDKRRYDLLQDVVRFQAQAPEFLKEVERDMHREMTVGGFLAAYKYSDTFRDVYMLPMIAAIWSVPKVDSMMMPMRTLIRFMVNHHLHKIKNRPKWRTVVDRSRQYVERAVAQLKDVRLSCPVTAVRTVAHADGVTRVEVTHSNGVVELFDDVVLATHTDITRKLLGDAITEDEERILSKIKYQPNKCVLHTDTSIMPANRNLWASWNVKEFPRDASSDGPQLGTANAPVCCSYWVNLLQNLDEGVQDVFVTLNPPHKLDNTILEFELSHPALNREAVEAQEQLPSIQGKRHVYFAGAWTRYGFHEDGILSAVNVAAWMGAKPLANAQTSAMAPSLPWAPRSPSPVPPSRLARLCLELFHKYAGSSVTVGSLRLLLPDGSERSYHPDASSSTIDKHAVVSKSLHQYHNVDLSAATIVLTVHDLSMFPRIVFGHSSIAMAEAYMDHLFDISLENTATRRRLEIRQYDANEKVDDRLGLFLYWCALNLNKIETNKNLLGGPAQFVGRQIKSFYHWQRQFNTIAQAKKHISMHYDLGNDLYELFLDKSMTYSSGMMPFGVVAGTTAVPDTLDQISANLENEEELKIEHAFLAANIQDGHRVLEIGCGWGSMAIYACTHAKCYWTALTLSKEQKAMMEERVKAAGLEDRIEVLLTDFRELVEMPDYRASFDRVVSLEMIEALGDGNLPGYFADINRFLKPRAGRVLIQAITIPDDRYEQYCKNTDFIKEYIFPGGHLPSRARIYWAIQEGNARVRKQQKGTSVSTDLVITEEVEFGKAYASTLRAWRLRMLRNRKAILALMDENKEAKYDARFIRMFEWYFAYCEVGFQQGLIHVVQVVIENTARDMLSKPILPATLRANRDLRIRTKPFSRFESHIMAGSVFHSRHDGVKNAFQYDTVMALLNLDDLYISELFKSRWYMSLNNANILAFHRADHFGDPKRMLKSCVLQLITDECNVDAAELETQIGSVFLLTTIRCLGYCFNPISIYYCMSFEDPTKCLYVVLEVTNTPWLEKHCYVLRADGSTDGEVSSTVDARFVKELHVSPFFKMDCEYRIRLNHPGMLIERPDEQLRVLLELHERRASASGGNEPEPEEKQPLGKKLFTASLNLTQAGANSTEKAAPSEFFLICAMAIMAWQAQLYIHWHALKLAVKGQPLIRSAHPAYKGKLRALTLYSMDLVKHIFIFAVALAGLGAIKALKAGAENRAVGIAVAAGLGAIAFTLA